MRVGKFFIVLLSLVSISASNEKLFTTTSTLNILEIKSSKVLSNFQGIEPNQSNQFNSYRDGFKDVYPIERSIIIKYNLVAGKAYQIRQIDENTFEVLGSPIEWED